MMVNEDSIKNIGIIIPNNPTLPGKEDDLLENLQNIPNEDLKKMGDDIYLRWIKHDLANGNYHDLNKDLAIFLLNEGYIKLLIDNIDKFKWLDIDVAIALIEKGHFKPWMLKYFPKKDRKAIFLKSFENNKDLYSTGKNNDCRNDLSNCDLTFASELIKLGYPLNELDRNLSRFKEQERTAIALLIAEHGGNITFSRIPKKYLNLAFVKELKNKGYSSSKIANNLSSFKEEDRAQIALFLVDSWVKNIPFKEIPSQNLDLKFAETLISKGFSTRNINAALSLFLSSDRKAIALKILEKGESPNLWSIPSADKNLEFAKVLHDHGLSRWYIWNNLGEFLGKDRKAIALIVLESGNDIDLDGLSAADRDNELACAMLDAGFKNKVKRNKLKFKWLSIATKLRLL